MSIVFLNTLILMTFLFVWFLNFQDMVSLYISGCSRTCFVDWCKIFDGLTLQDLKLSLNLGRISDQLSRIRHREDRNTNRESHGKEQGFLCSFSMWEVQREGKLVIPLLFSCSIRCLPQFLTPKFLLVIGQLR